MWNYESYTMNSPSYVKKPFVQHISYIEPHLVHITNPFALAMEVLTQRLALPPKAPREKYQIL